MKHKMPKPGKKCMVYNGAPGAAESYVELVLTNGYRIVSHGGMYLSGSDVHVLDKSGNEVGFWIVDEWAEDPELVMGAILNCAAGFPLSGNIHAKSKKIG